MKLTEFNYPLPKKLIAKHPAHLRDHSRLMVLDRGTDLIKERIFCEIIDYFSKGDCLVVNETKVYKARLFGKKEKTNANVEVFLLRKLSNSEENIWDVFVDPARKVRVGNKLFFDDGKLWCEVLDNTTSRGRTIRFNHNEDLFKIIERIGATPLPPYIKRKVTSKDRKSYQTVYAKTIGAVTAPAAGLHFTKGLLKKLEAKGVKIAPVLLHLGLGAMHPIEVEDLNKHKLDSEYFEISNKAANIINKTTDSKHTVFVVGTSTCRALESSVTADGHVKPARGWTDKFIFPPYQFKITNKLITNFHLPESPPLTLASAFGGHEFLMQGYKKAVKDAYRFCCYGDAMLIV
ncbi:MAG: tRNA preQ1(34) S-adenosylmethionine ribosyltransferase-isomerase QueA [Bacteroidota bacterium]